MKVDMKEDSLIFICSCSSLDHVVWFHRDIDNECFIHVAIDTQKSLWERIKIAFRLIFHKSPCRYFGISEVCVDETNIKQILDWSERARLAYQIANCTRINGHEYKS